MNAQFHTPSFGDEVFEMEIDNHGCGGGAPTTGSHYQLQQQQSKRMRSGMDQSLDEYHSANDDSFMTSTNNQNNSSNSHNASSHIHVGISGTPTTSTPTATTTLAARKQLAAPIDPDEPAKPLSAYALFFRDTVSAIKQQNPNCSFQELSRIVASMWEALDPTHKNVYNKKNEMARNEYLKQMRLYRQQQQNHIEQQQLANSNNNNDSSNNAALQTKPAVFTITRQNSDGGGASNNNMAGHFASPLQQQKQLLNTPTNALTPQQQQQQQFDISAQSPQLHQQQQQQQQQMFITSTPVAVVSPNVAKPTDPAAPQIQMLTEAAGSVQKCTRDNCSKRAIINPDWEDEYCSNECVVIHCRNVFNSWVQSNLEARKQ